MGEAQLPPIREEAQLPPLYPGMVTIGYGGGPLSPLYRVCTTGDRSSLANKNPGVHGANF